MDIEEIIKAFFEATNKRDLKAMDDLFSDGVEFSFPKTQPLIGKERVLRFFAILFRQYPHLTFQVHMTITETDRAAVHWTNKGANRRGEAYENEGVTILRLENSKICFLSDFFKDTGKF
ncbi:MAG: nuclear transport factor 2 family protein [Deltaproteobacteria bacterium]|nr:nuclear transport factor 2 family protein [Deltaproteobacteria bacterium]